MRTRLLMAGAFVGATVLLTTSMVFSWPVTVGTEVTPAEQERARAFDSPTGSCLTWAAADGSDMRRVDCAEPHVFEVTSNVDISREYPPQAPPPDDATWQTIVEEKCTPGATSYLGGTLDPFGKYKVNALKPSDAQWRDGDRKLRCGLQRAAPAGVVLTTTGSASDQDQSNVHEPGVCLALNGQTIGDPVPCTEPHAVEIVGTVDLSQAFSGQDYPAQEAQIEKAIELCGEVTKAYTGGADLAAKGLIPYPDALAQESWAAGSRRINCKVASKLPDGSGLAPVVGSVRAVQETTQPPASDGSTTSTAPTTSTGG